MDDDRIADIFDYFKTESKSDDINDAVEGLGGIIPRKKSDWWG